MTSNEWFNEDSLLKERQSKPYDYTDILNCLGCYTENELVEIFYSLDETDGYNPSNQIFKNYDFVFSGCSQTHGDHISPPLAVDGDYKKIWGFQMSDRLNMSTINLGMGGDSPYLIVSKLIMYFEKYGNPKILACLFSDLFRFQAPKSDNMITNNKPNTFKTIESSFHRINDINNGRGIPIFSKIPHVREHVVPQIWPVYYNLQSILFLEQYCNSNNIKLVWGTWHLESEIIIEKAIDVLKKNNKNFYKNFINTECKEWNNFRVNTEGYYDKCHFDLRESYPKLFAIGQDGQHMGIHRHTHIAEKMMESLNDNSN